MSSSGRRRRNPCRSPITFPERRPSSNGLKSRLFIHQQRRRRRMRFDLLPPPARLSAGRHPFPPSLPHSLSLSLIPLPASSSAAKRERERRQLRSAESFASAYRRPTPIDPLLLLLIVRTRSPSALLTPHRLSRTDGKSSNFRPTTPPLAVCSIRRHSDGERVTPSRR